MTGGDYIDYPTLREAVVAARAAAATDGSTVFVCRGERIGCDGEQHECSNCYVIGPHDRRSTDEHVRAFEGGDA